MEAGFTPRRAAKDLLAGVVPGRPLWLPIVFSLGAKVENVPPEVYRASPGKIAGALGQMRGPLSADGVSCYFDSWLEVEALGAALTRTEDGEVTGVRWPGGAERGKLPGALPDAREAAGRGRIPTALEVVRRMNAVPGREFLLMTGASGPLTLAARLAGFRSEEGWQPEDLPAEAGELAAAVVTELATRLVEAGSDLVVFREEFLPKLSGETAEAWAGLVAPAINVVRFYEALPVLQLAHAASVVANRDLIAAQTWDSVLCLPFEAARRGALEELPLRGLALPEDALRTGEAEGRELTSFLRLLLGKRETALVMTAADVAWTTDIKRLAQVGAEATRA